MPEYRGNDKYRHGDPRRIGVLLMNLGTPESPDAKGLRPYLREFLSDPRVVEAPRLLWFFALHGVILRLRPKRSAASYKKVWTSEGSPLMVISQAQARRVSEQLAQRLGDEVRVELAMSYGKPSVGEAMDRLLDAGMDRVLVLPLYPQYSGSTTASCFDATTRLLHGWRWVPAYRFVDSYHDHPAYITALANSVREHRAAHGESDKLLFSFHGTPRDYLDKGDPYFCQCQKTARLVAEALELSADTWEVTFQSRFGPKAWLQPYTEQRLKALPGEGVTSVAVICPGFSADCLETLEEIDEENRGYFLAAGGQTFHYIPALNDRDDHIDMMVSLVLENIAGWSGRSTPASEEQSRARARDLGAPNT